jgi:hypothetical protein
VAGPSAGVVLPPAAGSAFGANADPVPGFGNGMSGDANGTTGVTLGGNNGLHLGTTNGLHLGLGKHSLSLTPEPGTMLLTLTGLLVAFGATRRRREN